MYYLSEVVTNKIEAQLGQSLIEVSPVSGGDINDARLITVQDGQQFFVKINEGPQAYPMFQAEARGLEMLRSAAPAEILIPDFIACEPAGEAAFLLLEYIQTGTPLSGFWPAFGRGLAKLHRQSNDQFGLDHANFIGRLPQSNGAHDDWPGFYTHERLLPQGKMAYEQTLLDLKDMQYLERLCKQLGDLYPTEPPALIHGDLWSGNYLVHTNGQAVLIDPSVAYSHREMDLAMTRLFGGFPEEFYRAYQESYPLDSGWEDRLPLGQLYYLLVHLNMFGTSYLPSVKRILKQF
ncbi:fructosamine kinase family protein [Flavilitoribacter nigricans]|uniref:fructosamine kinase family protein n=1 Tax=Flavilitoribacter nigricans TaxID=70997 RepID=UPI001472BDF8|nr:fructosamine kinase family protein [Flavilitoribacter nigricans]